MKKIKILGIAVLVSFLLLGVCGCGKEEVKNVEGSLESIMEKLYADIPKEELPMFLENMEVTEENIESFVGIKDFDYAEILANESMTGSTAHSVVLVRTKDGADIEKIKKDIKENIDPRKWICVGIERDEVVVKNKGNLILVLVIQDETNREQLETAFDNL